MISLRSITDENRDEVEALRTSSAQERFVSTVVDSLAEAAEEPDGRAIYWAIYDDETPVGFVMISDEVGSPEYIPHFLWKLLIDERYQRRGIGTATLDLITEYFRGRPGVEVLSTSAGQGDGSPIPFYQRYGFERTGQIVFDGEELLLLQLSDVARVGGMNITYAWRGIVESPEVNALHAQAFGHPVFAAEDWDWKKQLHEHSLGWVCARDGGNLLGFVNVVWDGAVHAFVLDTMVARSVRRRGIGTELVAVAVTQARLAGCEWLHVDFNEDLSAFYFDGCGFESTNAGLIAL